MTDKKIILAIDDDPLVLGTFTKFLTSDYDLRISKSAADASILMDKIKPDLILLDIEMPDISGFEFLHTIKKNPRYMGVPVIIVSGHCEPAFIEHAEKGGASAVLAKPVTREDLYVKISEAFKKPKAGIFGL